MATRRNSYNDPAIREGLNNLAALFAPPSGAEMVASATMRAKQEEAARLADLHARAGRANLTPEEMAIIDRQLAVQTGGFQNSQWRFKMDDATTRRAQDVDASTKLRQTEMQQAGDTTRKMLDPVAAGATRFVPQSIARLYNVPGTQTGVVEMKPGERSVLPDGRTLEGAPKPLSSDETIAAVIGQELQRGGLTPRQVVGPKLGSPVEVQRPDGSRGFATPGDAMLGGMTPAPAAGAAARKDGMALLPDGRRVPVTRDPSGLQWQMQDGAAIPPDAQVFDLARPQGTNEQIGITSSNTTEANRLRAAVVNADGIIRDIDGLVRNNPAATGLAANVISFTQDLRQVLAEFGQAFGGSASADAPISPQQLQAMASGVLDKIAPNQQYNPVYRQARAMLLELAYSNARMNNPNGEVSRFALEREIEQLGLGGVGNDQAVLAVLGNARNRLARALDQADVLSGRKPGPTRESLSQPSAPAAPRPQTAPQAPARLRFDANGNQVQ